MASSVWSGHLNFALISIPVRLFTAARTEGISFNMLHRSDLSRVKQQLVCSTDGQVVNRDDIVKGYEFRKNEYVVINPEDIKHIEPQTSETIEILEFVQISEVDPVYFDASYFISPEDAGQKPFALLTAALQYGEYAGIAKVCMHNREYTVLIRSYEDVKDDKLQHGLMLHTLYYSTEVRRMSEVTNLLAKPEFEEVDMAMKLVAQMSNEWEPEKYFDGFKENLKKLITAKIEGSSIQDVKKVEKKPVIDLQAALIASLKATTKKK